MARALMMGVLHMLKALALVLLSSFVIGCANENTGAREERELTQSDLAVKRIGPSDVRWPVGADGKTRISVCWEPGTTPPEHQWKQEAVRKAIAETWSAVIRVEFWYWQDCTYDYDFDIRIRVADERASAWLGTEQRTVPVSGVATVSDGESGTRLVAVRDAGMVLNFTNKSFRGCQRFACEVSDAMHEFGHALGFMHEHQRSDATTCQKQKEGDAITSISGLFLSEYDPESIMNYCQSSYDSAPQLSASDVRGAQSVYGAVPNAPKGPVLADIPPFVAPGPGKD